MGLLGNTYDPYGGMSSLLGIDQKAMRNQALWNGLAAAGFTLMGNKNLGAAGGAFLQGTNQARDDYYRTALDAYRLKTAEEERAYQRERDAAADERWQMQWDYNKGRQQREDARQNTLFDWQLQDRQQEEDTRAGQQNQVQDWMSGFEAQGGNLFSPEMQQGLRQQGIQGVDPRDTQKYERMQPFVGAGMYPEAFQQMTAEPAYQAPIKASPGDVFLDPNTLQPRAAIPPAPPEPKTRNYLSGNERVYEELTPNGWVEIGRGPASAGAAQQTVNVGGTDDFDKKLMGGIADVYKDTFQQGLNSGVPTKNAVQQLRVLMQGQGGALDGLSAVVAPYLPEGLMPEGANDLVAAQAIIAGLIPKQRVPGSGTTSDYDARMFAQSLPSIWNQPGANEIILNTIEAYADYQIAVSNIIADVAADPNIKNKSGAIREAIKMLPDPFAEWKQAMGSGGAGGAGGEDPEIEDLLKKYGG